MHVCSLVNSVHVRHEYVRTLKMAGISSQLCEEVLSRSQSLNVPKFECLWKAVGVRPGAGRSVP